ncbi:hypothetical protein HRI_003913500 [Hibiscus trionum]|uniref:Uncharacterized protein n=1 Tax=Hibiscus trionum TaxID=183268 RepID=A0A9W7IWZ3_HIBTR|nr:hypothetical protein HRI_003913500 [Hibiscus trionum]
MQPLPTVNQAYSMLIQEESQRSHLGVMNLAMDSTILFSNSSVSRCRFNGICDHCKICGHKKENCFRLIGYPPDFKFTKHKDPSSAMTILELLTKNPPGDSVANLAGSLVWKDEADW